MPEPMKQPLVKAMWHELYIELLSSPLDQRTDKEFCEANCLSVGALGVWKRNNRKELFDEVQRRRVLYLNEMRALAYKRLDALSKKDVNAIKLMFQLTGDLVEQSKTTHEYLSRQDKIDRINNLLKDANLKAQTWKKVQESQAATDAVQGDSNISDVKHGDEPRKDNA